MAEQFSNKIETTVAVAYSAASGTLVVANDTGFPATGTFRVRLGNTAGSILRVNSRVGATLTVTAEADDGDADVGDAATIVLTAGALAQLKADAIAGSGGGGGGSALPPLDQSAWSWVNQDASVVTQESNVVRLTVAADSEIHARVVNAPSTPYVITADVVPHLGVGNSVFGLTFYESGTGRFVQMAVRCPVSDPRGLFSARRENSISSHASQVESPQFMAFGRMLLRMADDGTDLTLSYSLDGVNFTTLIDEARGTFFTTGPDQVGIFAQTFSDPTGISIMGWAQA
jgi:hypothetical protein